MTNPVKRDRTSLMVSLKTRAAVVSMTKTLTEKYGYRVTQSEAVKRGMEALEREIEQQL